MPIALSAKYTTKTFLPLDAELPESERLTFEVRFITILQARDLSTAIDGVAGDSWEQWRQRLNVAVTKVLVRAENVPAGVANSGSVEVPDLRDPDGGRKVTVTPFLDELLTDNELRDLAIQIQKATRLGYEELKKSKLQQPSAAG